jgi:predicted PurR-regulated permease PerM
VSIDNEAPESLRTIETEDDLVPSSAERRLPGWVIPAVIVFWSGFLGALAVRFLWSKLSGLFVLLAIALFLALAIEPGVNRLARRGWRRGRATALILLV